MTRHWRILRGPGIWLLTRWTATSPTSQRSLGGVCAWILVSILCLLIRRNLFSFMLIQTPVHCLLPKSITSLSCRRKISQRLEHFQGENDWSFPPIKFSIIKTAILSAVLQPRGFQIASVEDDQGQTNFTVRKVMTTGSHYEVVWLFLCTIHFTKTLLRSTE